MDTTKAFTEMTAEEQADHVKELRAQVEHKDDEHKQAMDDEEKKHESALKAMEDEKKKEAQNEKEKEKEAQDEKNKKLEAAIMKAMEDHPDDKDKREAAIRSAMEDHMKKEEGMHEEHEKKQAMEDDEEKKALKAQVTYLTAQHNLPKIEYLAAIYKAAGVEEKKITEYTADWKKQTGKQLDAAIEKVKPLIDNIPEFQGSKPEKKPFGFSTTEIPTELSGAVGNDKRIDKIEKMSDTELFESDGGIYS